MTAQHTPGLLPTMPLKVFNANGTTAILDANGNEVVGWQGFDDSNRSRAEHAALAHRIVQCVNAHDGLVEAVDTLIAIYGKNIASMQRGSERRVAWERLCDIRAAIAKTTGSRT